MIQQLMLLRFLSSLSLCLIPAVLGGREPQIEVQQILQTMQSWDGISYENYPSRQPQLTVLRIKVPPNTALHWHHHPVISAGYVLSGGTGRTTDYHQWGAHRRGTHDWQRILMKATRLVLAVMTLLARNTNAGTQEQLEACRQQIDSLDQRIVSGDSENSRVGQGRSVAGRSRRPHLAKASRRNAQLGSETRCCSDAPHSLFE
jgi:hypothetical protein